MESIQLLGKFEFGNEVLSEKNKEVRPVFIGSRRKIVEVTLRNNEVLVKHSTNTPITVFCLAGNGEFRAGENLVEKQELTPGVFITLEGGIEHEVAAQPEVHLLVTKFESD